MQNIIKEYYDELATEYDNARFANSYGQYIHYQEDKILKRYLNPNQNSLNLDVACGTGRFLNYANYGVDISEEMLKVAQAKFPNAKLNTAKADALPFEDDFFEHIISFHLMMHLNQELVQKILHEVHRVIQKGGLFIFDVPSEKRRKLTAYKSESWHGANHISMELLHDWVHENWEIVAYHGVSFFPIHRIPKRIRKYFLTLDNYLANSLLKEYSSYLVLVLRKK